jgi:HPt (histidine-containing phosphotransfer) domain-containing protein
MTAYAGDGVRDQCRQAGMDGYVGKPIQDRELLEAISEVLPISGGSKADLPTQPAETKAAGNRASVEVPLVDWAVALERVGGNEEMLNELIDVFRNDSAALLQETAEAFRDNDGPKLHRTAHTLKGMINFFGASTIARTALALEQLGAKSDFAAAQAPYESLLRDIERLLAELDARTVPV